MSAEKSEPKDQAARGMLSWVLRHDTAPVGDPTSAAAERLYGWIAESALPLIEVGGRLRMGGVRGALTFVITPLLAELCADEALMAGATRVLGRRVEAAARGVEAAPDPTARRLAERRWRRAVDRQGLFDRLDRDLVGAWRSLGEAGVVELATTPATDAVLPLIGERAHARPQIAVAVATHTRHFGAPPAGIDLTRGYAPRLDLLCAEYGLSWCLVGAAAFDRATAKPVYGRWAPLHCPTSGVAAFAVEPAASRLPAVDRGEFLDRGVTRAPASLHLAEHPEALGLLPPVERRLAAEPFAAPRDVDAAERAAAALGEAWVEAQRAALSEASAAMGRAAHRLAHVDAATLGRWWAEGPAFVEGAARAGRDVLTTPSAALGAEPVNQSAWPGLARAGGDGGFADAAEPARAWLLGALPRAARQMMALADRSVGTVAQARQGAQGAAQALLMAQCGDWVAMIEGGVAGGEAVEALTGHLEAFRALRAGQGESGGGAAPSGPFSAVDLEAFASW